MTGLIVEGGASRTYFAVGVMDAMMEHSIAVDYIGGASAGIANAISYATGQKGRSIEIGTKHLPLKRYSGLIHLLNPKNRSLYNIDYVFGKIPNELVPFDYEKYNQYEFTKCATCKDLYDQYRQSPQAESDANNFFNMMVTGNKLEPDVYAGEGLFKYMKAQATPFQEASTDINELVKGKSAIVLTVYYTKEGQIVVDFTPIDATP